jgi:hypothetical protein
MAEEETARSLEKPARSSARKDASRPDRPEAGARAVEEATRLADTAALIRRIRGKPAADSLSRISNGDPLKLYPLCARRIRETYFLLDPDRVFERALAEVAVGLELEAERCEAPEWLLEKIDLTVQSILEHDRADEHEGLPPDHPETHFRLFIEAFYVEPPLARLSSVRFNALDERLRMGFQKLMIDGLPLEEVLAIEGLGPPERLQLDILVGLKAIGLLDDAGVEELRWKGDKA